MANRKNDQSEKYNHGININEMESIKTSEPEVSNMSCGGDISPQKILKNVCAAIYITLDVEQSSAVAKYLSVVTNLVRKKRKLYDYYSYNLLQHLIFPNTNVIYP